MRINSESAEEEQPESEEGGDASWGRYGEVNLQLEQEVR